MARFETPQQAQRSPGVDPGADAGCLQHMTEVAEQPVADVDGGAGDGTQGQPQGDARLRLLQPQARPCQLLRWQRKPARWWPAARA